MYHSLDLFVFPLQETSRNSPGLSNRDTRLSLEVKTVRTRITLACTECKQRNYNTKKDKKEHPERLETKKYCKFCRKHTLHKETK